jgi:nucleoporin SEH1
LSLFLNKIQVWDQNIEGKWTLTSSWKAHSGSVWKVTWAHPEFGQVLATCSFDRTAAVWEEIGIYKFYFI